MSGLIAKTVYNITDWIKINRPHSKTMFVIFVVLLFPAINLENFYSSKFSHRSFFSLNLSWFYFKSACALNIQIKMTIANIFYTPTIERLVATLTSL